jgi:hypothetical protein
MKSRKQKAAAETQGQHSVADRILQASQKSFADDPHSYPKLHRLLEHAAQILKKKAGEAPPWSECKKA